ncbi:peptidoglycan DD-metalloendopeptidase family protein [Alphaproteobacteria bacterium KMM 3653]|uniref:Peptidoglycan DD-metalloendopeptidase family protein n=1 Tax=Harenicola maris TaxID=2841044 RepID=A0AAP2CPK4_9RHOB|nr:peptidoglycan DD-metalloendopeptidase family protein [Harenicola maris]
MILRLAPLLMALLLGAGSVCAQTDPAHIARRAAGLLEQAAADLQTAEGGRGRVAALTKTVRAYEEGLTALRASLRQAAIQERTLRLGMEAKRAEVARLLGVLSVLERAPRPLLLLHPSGPAGTARAGMMLSEVTPALQAEAQLLREQLDEISALQALQKNASERMTEGLTGAQQARAALSKAIGDRTDLPRRVTEDPEVLRSLLQTSDTLAAFAAGLASTPAAPGGQDFDALRGTLPLPGPATVLRAFDEADAAGVRRPGLLLAMAPGTLITSPAAATIRYAGPLLDYGNVMVIEPSDGALMVLAGLDAIYGAPGDVVPMGSPLGLMPGGQGPETETLADPARSGSAERSETLYMELRLDDVPVDPAPWFTLTKDG